jgi:two-component system CheB/CheR fusion protein
MVSAKANHHEQDVDANTDLKVMLGHVIDMAIAVTEANFGNIQLITPEGNLKIYAYRNLPDWWIKHWDTVKSGEGSCGTALATGSRIIVEDVEQSPIFAETPGLDTLLKIGIRSNQSTPLVAASGQVLGVFSTYYTKRYQPNALALKILDLLANHSVSIIELDHADRKFINLQYAFQGAIESSADGFWVVDDQLKIIAVNQSYLNRSGYSREEILQMRVTDIDVLFDKNTAKHQLDSILKQGSALFETRHRTKSGELWPVEVNAVYQPKAGGKIYSFLRDIAVRKASEKALQESEKRFRAIYKYAPVGIKILDPSTGRIISANPDFCRMLGYQENELHGLSIEQITYEEDMDSDRDVMLRILNGKANTYHTVKRYLQKNGTIVWAEVRGIVVRDEDGKINYSMGAVHDLSALRQSEDLARQRMDDLVWLHRQQTASELASLMAHELNQPLAAIAAYAGVCQEILKRPHPDTKKLKLVTSCMCEQSIRAGDTIHHIRNFVASNGSPPQPIDLNAAIRSTKDLMDISMRLKKIKLVLNLVPEFPSVMGVEVHIQQILINLLRNAMDAIEGQGPDGGMVTVKAVAFGNNARVTVTDTGPGVSHDQVEEIFNKTMSQKQDGLGLGLRISRSLVESDGGKLWAEANAHGGIFHFEVPLS